MKRPLFIVTILLMFVFNITICQTDKNRGPDMPADLVLRNGKIVIVEGQWPHVSALAITGDRIVAIGSDRDILRFTGKKTEVIDLKGMLAIPGFIEGHGHFYSLGASLMQLELRYAKNWDAIISLVAAEVEKIKPGTWIIGRGWHQDKWDVKPQPNVEGLPLHHELSAVSPQNPVFLSHTSGHGVFVNQAAMQAAGITRGSG